MSQKKDTPNEYLSLEPTLCTSFFLSSINKNDTELWFRHNSAPFLHSWFILFDVLSTVTNADHCEVDAETIHCAALSRQQCKKTHANGQNTSKLKAHHQSVSMSAPVRKLYENTHSRNEYGKVSEHQYDMYCKISHTLPKSMAECGLDMLADMGSVLHFYKNRRQGYRWSVVTP